MPPSLRCRDGSSRTDLGAHRARLPAGGGPHLPAAADALGSRGGLGRRRRCCARPTSCSRSWTRCSRPGSCGSRATEVLVEPPIEALRIMVAAQAVHADRTRQRLESLTDAVGLLADEAHAAPGRPRPDRPGRGRGDHRLRHGPALRDGARPDPAQPRRPALAAPRPVARSARGRDGRAGRRGAAPGAAAARGRSTRCTPPARRPRSSPPGSPWASRSGCCPSCRPG